MRSRLVSQSIANLEIAIDQELFNREKNIPVLTSTGKALLPVAKSILDQQKYFDQKVESLAQEDDHELSKLPVVQDSDLKRYRQCVQSSSKQRELWFTYGISSMLWYANTHKTIIDLVEQNVGWANVPEMMVMEGINKGETRCSACCTRAWRLDNSGRMLGCHAVTSMARYSRV